VDEEMKVRLGIMLETKFLKKLEVFSEDIPHTVLWYNCGTKCP